MKDDENIIDIIATEPMTNPKELTLKFDMLATLYRIHGQALQQLAVACEPECCACCTSNLTLTTLEGMYLLGALPEDGWRERTIAARRRPRLIPQLTINQLADRCAADLDVPDEIYPEAQTPCPLLRDRLCTVYQYRPLGCRAMISRQRCAHDGQAEMEPFALTLNQIFMQSVEHLDRGGLFGNICDVLQVLDHADARQACLQGRLAPTNGLLPNAPLKVLMAPPEHKDRLMPILAELNHMHHSHRSR